MVSNLTELKTELKKMGIPGTYYKFDEENAPGLPFYVFYTPETDSFDADNISYVLIPTLYIELYTEYKDIEMEKKMESILRENDMPFRKEEEFLEDENCYMITYTTQFVEE